MGPFPLMRDCEGMLSTIILGLSRWLPTVIIDEAFYVTHDLGVASVRGRGHLGQKTASLIVCRCRLRVQHERDRQ